MYGFSLCFPRLRCILKLQYRIVRRGRPSLRSRSTQSTYRGKYAQASGILSPASSQVTSDETEGRAVLTRFEEWPPENALLKRITENGKTTF